VEWIARRDGAGIRSVSLTLAGRIDTSEFAAALPGAALATALVANNEVGTVNPAAGLAEAAASERVPLHLDAIAAFGHVPVSFAQLRGDARPGAGLLAMSVSAHKVGGPIGVGALVVARSARLDPLLHGGGQQRGLRSGTQDVAGAAAFAVAAELAVAELAEESERLSVMRDRLIAGVLTTVPGAELLGDSVDRLPGNAHILFPGGVASFPPRHGGCLGIDGVGVSGGCSRAVPRRDGDGQKRARSA
jgi:cysteine desulfurase